MTTSNNTPSTNFFHKHKSDIFKMGGAALFTLLVIFLIHTFSNFTGHNNLQQDNLISTDSMNYYYNQYPDSERIPIWYELNKKLLEGKLEGFPIPTKNLEEIIYRNKYSGKLGQNVVPDTILFYIGQNGTTTHNRVTHGKYKLIAIGIKNKQLLIPDEKNEWGLMDKSSIYDKADPCPGPGCPVEKPWLTPTSGSGQGE